MSRGCNSLRDVADLMNADVNSNNPGDDMKENNTENRIA